MFFFNSIQQTFIFKNYYLLGIVKDTADTDKELD